MEIECWKTSNGKNDVFEAIDSLKNNTIKNKILSDLEIIERSKLNNCICSGLIFPLHGTNPKIYEIKVKDVRITLYVKDHNCWLLTLFIKNSQKTPLKEIHKAERRAKNII